jgi:hypothetical protein
MMEITTKIALRQPAYMRIPETHDDDDDSILHFLYELDE